MSSGTIAGEPTPALPEGVRRIRESPFGNGIPLHTHPGWATELEWLAQGTTGHGGVAFDLGLFGDSPVGPTLTRWEMLRRGLGMPRAVHARQVHGAEILEHEAGPPGLHITSGYDGHRTEAPGLLLTVSVADCVPIFVVDPRHRLVLLLHGGWRGTAAGILPRALREVPLAARVRIHLGPAVCGHCYEVGPEVHDALGLPVPAGPAPADVRAVLARQAVAAGVPADAITVSEHCTRCGTGFFSYRAGDAGRQLGVLGIRP